MSQLIRHTVRVISTANAFKSTAICASKGVSLSIVPQRSVARWVKPTLRELRARRDKYGIPEEWKQRSSFIEWNYKAELYAFARRLNENVDQNLLEQVFVDRSYIVQEEMRQRDVQIENPIVNMKDNGELVVRGEEILREYVFAFLQTHLPKFPVAGIKAVREHLLQEETLANISKNLGTIDIILCDTYPPNQLLLANTFKAFIGARAESAPSGDTSSLDAAYNFVRDFVCTQLNQLDINEIWPTEEPYKILQEICGDHGINQLEPRHIGEAGRNTILATYHIGIYDGETKKLLGTGFGESVENGVDLAARNALAKLFGTYNLAPLNYGISVKECFEGKDSDTLRLSHQ